MDFIQTISVVVASTVSGFLEIIIFHPLDTIVKRLMVHTAPLKSTTWMCTLSNISRVIFRGEKSNIRKFCHCFQE